jgi:hypothetical protein
MAAGAPLCRALRFCGLFNLADEPWEVRPTEAHIRRRHTMVLDIGGDVFVVG